MAASTTAASVERGMKAGTASRGGAPPSPVIVVEISAGCWDAGGVAGACADGAWARGTDAARPMAAQAARRAIRKSVGFIVCTERSN